MESHDLRVETPQGRTLHATISLPPQMKHPLILMAHGFLGFKDWSFFPWVAEYFNQAGFPVLRFNFSGSGMGASQDGPFTEPEAFQADTLTRQVEDLRWAATEAVRGSLHPRLPAETELFLWGHSRGAGVCLLAAGKIPETRGVACWAGIARVNRYFFEAKQAWRRDGFSAVESNRTKQTLRYGTAFLDDAEAWGKEGDIPTFLHHLAAPVLLVHGSEDTSVPPEESESLAAVKPTAQLAILAGADHKFNCAHPFLRPTGVLVEAVQKTVRFFEGVQG
jgi:pimeloyl-ACP methyl ester carboxylesterase